MPLKRFRLWAFLVCALFTGNLGLAQKKGLEVQTHKMGINAYPYAYYTPETELAFGAGGIVTFYTSGDSVLRPSKIALSGYYSTNNQYKFSLVPFVYFGRNKWLVTTPLDFGRYVARFYGIGSATADTGNVDYVTNTLNARLELQFPPLTRFSNRSGVIYDLTYNNITDMRENAHLGDDLTGVDGGLTSGIGLAWVWDNRDHTFFPNKGGLHQVRFIGYFSAIGSDYTFNTIEVDLRRYFAFKPDKVLAIQVYANFATGEPPFYKLPALGGQNRMRGYFYGRFRDKQYLMAQAEFRTYVWWRLGFAAFFGIGDVADKFSSFAIGDFKRSYGFGLRFKFNQNEKVNLRVDFGFGKDTHGIYFGLEEAF